MMPKADEAGYSPDRGFPDKPRRSIRTMTPAQSVNTRWEARGVPSVEDLPYGAPDRLARGQQQRQPSTEHLLTAERQVESSRRGMITLRLFRRRSDPYQSKHSVADEVAAVPSEAAAVG